MPLTFKRLLLASVLLLSGTGVAGETLRIGRIFVRPLDVYSEAEAGRGAVYSIADRLHVETRESVIRKFLLFREGEELRPERLAETERTLRALSFIKSASVTMSEPHDGIVDVTVTTQDAWSIAPETQAGSKGGVSSYGASISDTNLLGLGKEMSISWDKTTDRTRYGIDYQDPAINSSFWNAHLGWGLNSDGHDRRFQLRRPFYSFATPWAVETSFRDFRRDDRLYAGGSEVERFRRTHHEAIVSFGRAIRPNDQVANRLIGGLRLEKDDYGRPSNPPHLGPGRAAGDFFPMPANRDYRYLFVRFEHAHNDYLKLNFVNKDLRYEDFNLGQQYSVETAVSPSTSSNPATGFVRAAIADGVRFGESSFIVPSIAVESRMASGPQNSVVSATLHLTHRYAATRFPAATVARLQVNNGWRLDGERQFFADGVTGLRGYRMHTFAGSRSIVANVEHRLYLGEELAQLFSPGVVVFADAGNATYGGFRSLLRLKVDAGIGLRIGLPRTPKNLVRIDLAYALQRDPLGRRGLLVSFSSGQAF